MVDLINHGGTDPASSVDNLGIRKEKRKRVNETQVPLPANKRPHIFQPGNRVAILECALLSQHPRAMCLLLYISPPLAHPQTIQ